MAKVDTMGYSIDELKAIASGQDNSSVDTQGYSIDELKAIAGQKESLPQTDITLGGVAKSFMEGVNDPKVMGGGVYGGATKALGDMYSTNKENLLNLIQDKGALPTSDLGKPFGIDMTKTPVARTSASLLTDIAAGVLGAKAQAGIEGVMANGIDKSLAKFGINLANKVSLRTIAQDADVALQSAKDAFDKSYSQVLEAHGNKIIPDSYKNQIRNSVSNLLDKLSPADPAFDFFDKGFKGALGGENLNVNALHSLKQQIYSKAGGAGGELYDTVSNVLGSKGLGGKEYSYLTSQYKDFVTKELPYIEKKIYDFAGNVSSEKLASERFGIKTPIKLKENYRTAFESLVGRPTTKTDMLSQLDSLRKISIAKRVVGTALLAGASAVVPPVRKTVSAVTGLLG